MRAYHDAIYEEEYGSESEEDCCRGRGLSAILCWFLSVIILIGLAASVVLTVFFILKSRSVLTKNDQDDLSFVFDHGNGFKIAPSTVSTLDVNLNSTSSKAPAGHNGGNWMHTTSYVEATARAYTTTTTTTTKLPPTTTTTRFTTRKYYSDTTGDSYSQRTTPIPTTSESNNMFKLLFNTIKTFQGGDDKEEPYSESIEQPPIEEITDNNSEEQPLVPHPIPATSSTPMQHQFHSVETTIPQTMTTSSPVLFTLPPSTSTMSQSSSNNGGRRNFLPTRPPERTSFSSEDTSASTYKHYDYTKHYIPPTVTSSEEMTTVETTSSVPSLESTDSHESPQTDESHKLSSMLLDQIPPHDEHHDDEQYQLTTAPPSSGPTHSEDKLAKIIRNLQPKWNRSRSEPTTTPRPRNRYIEIRTSKSKGSGSSQENLSSENFKAKSRPTTTLPPTTIIIVTPDLSSSLLPSTKTGASTQRPVLSSEAADNVSTTGSDRKVLTAPSNTSPIQVISGPNLKPDHHQVEHDETNENMSDSRSKEFLDVVVGSDDHKTLITKQTDAGIITSAILPPWYDTSNNSSDSLELANQTLTFTTTARDPDEDDNDSANDHSKPKTDLDILLNLFSNSPLPASKENSDKKGFGRKETKPKSQTYVSDVVTPDESKAIHLKKLEEQLKPFFSSPAESETPPKDVSPANTAFHYGSSDGKTHVYGYYPDEDVEDGGVSVDHLDIEIGHGSEQQQQPPPQQHNRRNSSDDSREGSNEERVDVSDGQSPVIDIAYDPKVQPEIVIEPDPGELDDDYTETDNFSDFTEPMAAGSDAHGGQVYVPPPANMINRMKHGSGIGGANDGGGIRWPMKNDRKHTDTVPAASEWKDEQSEKGAGLRKKHSSSKSKWPGKDHVASESEPEWASSDVEDNPAEGELVRNESDSPPKAQASPSKDNIKTASGELSSEKTEWSTKHEDTVREKPGWSSKEQSDYSKEYSPEQLSEELQATEQRRQVIQEEPKTKEKAPATQNTSTAEATFEETDFAADQKVERKPIVDLDASLYDIKEDVTTTTTPKPRVRVYEVYSEPYRPSAPEESKPPSAPTRSEEIRRNQTGFNPPQPINFHENTYAVASQSSTEYVSRDGWRPVVYGRGEERKGTGDVTAPPPPPPPPSRRNQFREPSMPFVSTSMRPPGFSSPPTIPITTPIHIPQTTPLHASPTTPTFTGPWGEDGEEMVRQEFKHWLPDNPFQAQGSEQKKLKIKPSRPMLPDHKPIVRFPDNPQQQPSRPQPQQQQSPYRSVQHRHLPIPQPHPAQIQSPQHSHVHHQGVQQQQPAGSQNTRQVQQPYPQSQNHSPQGSEQDRGKFGRPRPTPRIVMRRKPAQFSLPFAPGNRKRVTKIKVSGPPRKLPPYPLSSPDPFQNQPLQTQPQLHDQSVSQSQSQPIRPRLDPFQQTQSQVVPPPGTVHWPPDDRLVRRQQQPFHQSPLPFQQQHQFPSNRKPSG